MRAVRDRVFAFAPNRDTLGATAYLIVENDANFLIDSPPATPEITEFLQTIGVRWLALTHRGAMAGVDRLREATGCEVAVQEREAYLLPGVAVTTFADQMAIADTLTAIWTPGHSPGSSCYYYPGGKMLFSGRHLLCDRAGDPVPLRTAKTFHWPRQLESVRQLRDRFSRESLQWICPGANTGFLRGKGAIENAGEKLQGLDLEELARSQPLL